jgi:AraC-like DNA-binding protein/ligand-binding sensor protein
MELGTAMNGHGKLVEKLGESDVCRTYERAYTEVTGMPVSLRPLETWQLPHHGGQKDNPFCILMSEKGSTCAACVQLQDRLAQGAKKGPCLMTCGYGLCEMAVPVRLGGTTIGFLQTGQVLRQSATKVSFDRVVQAAKERGVDMDNSRTRAAFEQTLVVSRKKMESVESLLAIFADHLSLTSNQIAIRMANDEPPMVAKAKQFIEEHHTEDLSLGQVAAAVKVNIFCFCKLFKKAAGINFTEYVSRVRVEKTKNLLLNPNLRVSQVAYEAGFQSLTHFNRVFKTVAGESPTDYRSRLLKAA